MKSVIAAFILACAATFVPVRAEVPDCPPWLKAQATLDAALPEVRAHGIRAMAGHATAFEAELADRGRKCDAPTGAELTILTDGEFETQVVLATAQKALPGTKIVIVHDPYPGLALYLGSYYNEIGRYEDALRVLEAENAINEGTLGDTRSALISERAVSLGQLHRQADALALYEAGMKIDNINDKGKARMLRGKGFMLTEMDRLDEAEAAYRESLRFEPGNYVAQHELEYILKLKLGGKKVPMGIPVLPSSQPKTD